MKSYKGISVLGTGSALGSRTVRNSDIAGAAGTTDEWIRERTGIEERHYCGEGESQTALAVRAARQALERSGLAPQSIGLCIAATMTPEFSTPSTACIVQRELGLCEDIASYDINAACSGFLYAMDDARARMYMDDIEYALVIGSEKFSDILDMNDCGTAILFGDGAGAAVIAKSAALYSSLAGSRGSDVIWAKGPGSEPAVLHMQGRQVFKFATAIIEKSIIQVLERVGLTTPDADHFIIHQANERILDHAAKRMGLDQAKLHKTISHTGNTSAASVPILLDQAVTAGHIQKGDIVVFAGFGGGLTWAAAVMEWS